MNLNRSRWQLYWHTIKHLRKRQIIYRIYYMLSKLFPVKIKIYPYEKRLWPDLWSSPELFDLCIEENGSCVFLGDQGYVNKKEDWNDPTKEKLWLYHLHYLHDLNARKSVAKVSFHRLLINQWIVNNPPTKGVGWEPYPLSLRIVNLIKWFSRHVDKLEHHWLINLGLQAQALEKQIEYHILANHLFANAKALIFVGTYLKGKKSSKWLKKGLQLIDKEILEQFLPDGAHFELSPMYHANLIWDLCDLVHLAQISQLSELKLREKKWAQLIERGLLWLALMSHPDGELSFFNDASFKMAPTYAELIYYANQLGITTFKSPTITHLQYDLAVESGYCSIYDDEGAKLIIDVAEVGASYQPGHAHADTLSFELSLFKQRFIVNTGVSEYGQGKDREYQRSTLAHNTVCINNQNSSVVWSGFRVAQRAKPRFIDIKKTATNIMIKAAHTGYRRFPLNVLHKREWSFSPNRLIVTDYLEGDFAEARVRFHFHPNIQLLPNQDSTLTVLFPLGGIAIFKIFGNMDWFLEETYWCPEFGRKQANYCFNGLLKENSAAIEITW